MVTDEGGNILEEIEFNAYGEITGGGENVSRTSISEVNSRAGVNLGGEGSDLGLENLENLFVGAYGIKYDGKTNLHYMRYRWYSADQMRFLSPDLLLGINRYSYALGNPIRVIDPSGMVDIIIYHEVGHRPNPKEDWEMKRFAETIRDNHYPNAVMVPYDGNTNNTAIWVNDAIIYARQKAKLEKKEDRIEHLILIGHSAKGGMTFSKRAKRGNFRLEDVRSLPSLEFTGNLCKLPKSRFDYQVQIYACSGGHGLSEQFDNKYRVSSIGYREGVAGSFAKSPYGLPRIDLPLVDPFGNEVGIEGLFSSNVEINPNYTGPLYMVPKPPIMYPYESYEVLQAIDEYPNNGVTPPSS